MSRVTNKNTIIHRPFLNCEKIPTIVRYYNLTEFHWTGAIAVADILFGRAISNSIFRWCSRDTFPPEVL